MKTHPLQAKFGKNSDAVFIHAEIMAIHNALRVVPLEDLTKATLYVIRWYKGRVAMSKPCSGCQRAIAHFGIKDCYWSEDD